MNLSMFTILYCLNVNGCTEDTAMKVEYLTIPRECRAIGYVAHHFETDVLTLRVICAGARPAPYDFELKQQEIWPHG